MASSVRAFNAKFANVQGASELSRYLAALPDRVKAPIQAAIDETADEFVAQAKAIAPVAPDFEVHPGQLRDSIHKEANGREMSATVLADARDEKGRQYPAHVEYGHTDERSGAHVPAEPFFWPTYRVTKKRARARVAKALRQVVKGES